VKESAGTRGVPFCRPDITDAEIAEVVDTLRSGWITTGPKVKRFEDAFAKAMGAPWAVAVSSCTAALHVSLVAAGCRPGDEVITTVNTFSATAASIIQAGATPVLVDIEEDTFNMDPAQVERAVSKATRAILPVHLAGHPCEMDRIGAAAKARGIAVVEDAAHALPASFKGRKIGMISDLTCFSFYATKNLTTGEGGMITGLDPDLREKVGLIGYHGMSRDGWRRYLDKGSWYYEIVAHGFKYNLTDIAAAMGLKQLERLDAMQRRRAEVVRAYSAAFAGISALELPIARAHVDHAWHLYIVRLRQGALRVDREGFIRALAEKGIGTSVHFIPLYRHPYYQRALGVGPDRFPVAERVFASCVSLPLFSAMTDSEVAAVIEAVKDVVREKAR
jgi:dTDP-4-amino-4,6-dideoxygalactose transaminase